MRRRRQARPQPKLHRQGPLWAQVHGLLLQRWSPQQIAGHLRKCHPHTPPQRVSHESIYNAIYAQPRGELRKELIGCLRMARATRWPRSRGTDRRREVADLLFERQRLVDFRIGIDVEQRRVAVFQVEADGLRLAEARREIDPRIALPRGLRLDRPRPLPQMRQDSAWPVRRNV